MHISLAPEVIFHIGSFPITNTLLMSWLIMLFLVAFSLIVRKEVQLVPGKLQNFVEIIFEGILDLIQGVTQDRQQAIKFFPLITTIFTFVLLANWIEILPGLGTIGIYEIHGEERVFLPFVRAASADLNVTVAIAVVAMFFVQFFGVAAKGFFKYFNKFFVSPLQKPYGVGTFVGLLELISEVAKVVSFSFRLFGNIFAGEVLLLVILFLVPLLVPLPFLVLEIFVGLIQAVVFAMLTLVFLKMAVTEEAH